MNPLIKTIQYDYDVIIKAEKRDGKRVVALEASNNEVDLEGDVILQEALLNSKDSFLADGHIDIDHLSEIGASLNPPIPNPNSYIVGVPLEVNDLGGGRTEVVCEISQSSDGSFDPKAHQYDMLWESLNRNPPVKWRASIFGYPIAEKIEDCSQTTCSHGATRYLVKGIDWRSLAFTRTPMNDKIKGFARIISTKALIKGLKSIKSGGWWSSESDIFGPDEPVMEGMVGGLAGNPGGSILSSELNPNHVMSQNSGTITGAIIGSTVATKPEDNPFEPVGTPINKEESPCNQINMDVLWEDWLSHISIDCPCYNPNLGLILPFIRDHYMVCRGLDFNKADVISHALMYKIFLEYSRGLD